MEFRNFTPFPALAYQALDQQHRHYHVVVMRQTLAISANGELSYCDDQEPLVVADEYFGEMNRSSVKQESDLAPFKPRCDVIVVATAYAPGGQPAPSFEVRARILRSAAAAGQGEGTSEVVLDKALTVTGPRFWQRQGLFRTWRLSDPEPIESLPLRYEYAFGGELKIEDVDGQQAAIAEGQDPRSVPPVGHTVVESNPVGLGFMEEWFLRASELGRVAAPQIEDPLNPVTQFGERYPAQGYGVITKAWLPRRQLAGTADDAFARSERWLPEDFDFAFWNGAHPDLQTPYLQGDEIVELTNLTPEGELRFALPGHRPFILVRHEEGDIDPIPINLDTLIIDADAKTVTLVHRLMLPIQPEVRVLEARLISSNEWNAASTSAGDGAASAAVLTA